jgi:hypothetical protein
MAAQRTRSIGLLLGAVVFGVSLALPVAALTPEAAAPLVPVPDAPVISIVEPAAVSAPATGRIGAAHAAQPVLVEREEQPVEPAATNEAVAAVVVVAEAQPLPAAHAVPVVPMTRSAAVPGSVAPAPAAQNASSPAQAVTAFYASIAQRQLDAALQHWSPRMRANYPPAVYLYDRFSGTRQMIVQRADVVSMNASTGQAVVAVDLVETSSMPAFNRAWRGTWHLVRTPGGVWQLDAPSFRV